MWTSIFFVLFLISFILFLWSQNRYYKLLSETIKLRAEKEVFQQGQEILENKFKTLAISILDQNSNRFLEVAKATLAQESLQASHNFQNLIRPIETLLSTYQKNLDELEGERRKSYSTVENELQRLAQSNKELIYTTQHLKDALKRPHVRGRWGEMQLKNCIDLAGMSEYCDVTFQHVQTDAEGQRLIPDMTVKMPSGRLILVDAKTPLDAFLAYVEPGTNDETRRQKLDQHGKQIKAHIDGLSLREYGERFQNAADMVVMFIPNESFLYAALESHPDLVEYALKKKILVATPPTFIGLLKVIRLGWTEKKLAENAQEISKVGAELHNRIATFMEGFKKMGEHLQKANEEYKSCIMRVNDRIATYAQKLEELGAKGPKEIPHLEQG